MLVCCCFRKEGLVWGSVAYNTTRLRDAAGYLMGPRAPVPLHADLETQTHC